MTPETCCGARCRGCSVWRLLEEPATRWCSACRATTYTNDRGVCVGCAEKRAELVEAIRGAQ